MKRRARCMPLASSATSSCAATAARSSSPCSSALDRKLHDHGQQGHQDRGPREVAAQRRPGARQDLQPVDTRRSRTVPHRPVFLARQVRRQGRHQGRGSSGNRVKIAVEVAEGKRSKIRQINVVGNGLRRRRTARAVQAAHAELALLVQAGRPLLARRTLGRHRETALVPWTAATRTWTSSRRRWRSVRTRTTSSSP